jgi:ubiquinone/menaquinone biosynthesis C-methylase UbiE
MYLSDELKKKYTKEQLSARDAQRMAEFIAFGPIVFEVSRIMLKWGIFDLLRDKPMTIQEVAYSTRHSEYAIKCLLEASLTIGTVIVDVETNKFEISKTGWFLVNDHATRVNIDFNHDVNYKGMFNLEEALAEGRPAGLSTLGNWPTVYEGLSQLPEDAQKSWFAFDHFYSDSSFDEALQIVFAHKPKTLLDVGGNTGRWAMQCVNHDDEVNVTIMDLAQQLKLMQRAVEGTPNASRINGFATDMLDECNQFPTDKHYDAIWMSQFLDCFSLTQIESILVRAAKIMDENTTLFIMETLWDRQKYEPAAFCLTQISLYFTCIANGNSKMYHSEDLIRAIEKAGLKVKNIHDNLGQGHSILEVTKQ